MPYRLRIYFTRQRKYLISYKISGYLIVKIRTVRTVSNIFFLKKAFYLRSRKAKKGAYYIAPYRPHPSQPCNSASPEQIKQHRFGLVHAVMGHGNPVCARAGQYLITGYPARLLQGQPLLLRKLRHIHMDYLKLNPKLFAELYAEVAV